MTEHAIHLPKTHSQTPHLPANQGKLCYLSNWEDQRDVLSLDSMVHTALNGSKEHHMKATPFPKIESLDFNTSYTIH